MAKVELKAKLSLNSSAFHRGLSGALGAGKKLGASLARDAAASGRKLGEGLGRGAKLGMLAISGAAIGAGAALAVGVRKAYSLGAELKHLSDQSGITSGRLMVMRQALEDNGIEADSLGIMINRMQRRISDASDGSSEAASQISKLGISLSQVSAMSPDQQFMALGRAINGIADADERAAASMGFFGRSGGKLLSLFGEGGAMDAAGISIGRQAKLMDENSGIFDAISVRLERVGTKLQGFFVGVASKLQNVILPLLDKIERLDLASAGEKFGDGLIRGTQALVGAFKNPKAAISLLVDGMTFGMLSVGNILIAAIRTARQVFQDGFEQTIIGIGPILEGVLTKAFETPIAYLQAGVEAVMAKIPVCLDGVDEKAEAKKERKAAITQSIADLQQMSKQPFGSDRWLALAADQSKQYARAAELEPAANGKAPTLDERAQRIRKANVVTGSDGLTGDQHIEKGKQMLTAGLAQVGAKLVKFNVQDELGAGAYKSKMTAGYAALVKQGAPQLAGAIAPTARLAVGRAASAVQVAQIRGQFGVQKANEMLYGKDEADLMNRRKPLSYVAQQQLRGMYGVGINGRGGYNDLLTTSGALQPNSSAVPLPSRHMVSMLSTLHSSSDRTGLLIQGSAGGLGTGAENAYHLVRHGDAARAKAQAKADAAEKDKVRDGIDLSNDHLATIAEGIAGLKKEWE